MQARRAARELAFILFSQFEKKITNYSKDDLQDIILKSVRILTSSAGDELKNALGSLISMREQIENYEADSEINLNRPIGAVNLAVPIPMTSDMTDKINVMIDIAEKSLLALEIAEFTTLDSQNDVKDYDGILIDTKGRTVSVDGKNVDLSLREYELLKYLLENENVALSRDKILNNVWNYDYYGDSRTIDSHIKKIRHKLGKKGKYIKTMRGVGYKFEI